MKANTQRFRMCHQNRNEVDSSLNNSRVLFLTQFAEHSGYLFYETSAKESLNVDTVFVNLVYRILKQVSCEKLVAVSHVTSSARQ